VPCSVSTSATSVAPSTSEPQSHLPITTTQASSSRSKTPVRVGAFARESSTSTAGSLSATTKVQLRPRRQIWHATRSQAGDLGSTPKQSPPDSPAVQIGCPNRRKSSFLDASAAVPDHAASPSSGAAHPSCSGGVDQGVQRGSDRLVPLTGRVLVEYRGPGGRVTEPRHHLLQCRVCGCPWVRASSMNRSSADAMAWSRSRVACW